MNRIIRQIIIIMKNDKKNREIKTQWLRIMITIRLMIWMMIVTKMMTRNEYSDQNGIYNNENNTGNDTDDRIVSIIRIIMIRIMTDKIIIIRMIMIKMT